MSIHQLRCPQFRVSSDHVPLPPIWVSTLCLPLCPFLTELSRRNFSCIGCGCPRPSTTHAPSSKTPYLPVVNLTQFPSPRFVAAAPEPQMPVSPPHQVPHILTPSGRAFSVGGRVQDVSSDPLSPCIVFWPDNEPFPEQSQIRPSNLVGIPVCVTFSYHSVCLDSWHSRSILQS